MFKLVAVAVSLGTGLEKICEVYTFALELPTASDPGPTDGLESTTPEFFLFSKFTN